MNNKYYMGYLLNPEETITNGFQEKEKIKCILINNGLDLRELFTDAKFLEINENEVIDGKKIFDNNASLIGYIDKEISIEDVVNFIFKSEIDKVEYVNLLIKLISNTRKKAIQSIIEYYEMEKKFEKEININRK